MSYKYSVVIPTREGYSYLNSAIQSCLVSPRQDIEVIVVFNGPISWQHILERYDPLQDARIKYILAGKHLSLPEVFNFGVLQSRGAYVTSIGDDDALLPSAYEWADAFFAANPNIPLCWFRRPYFWPSYQQQPFSSFTPNTLHCWTGINLGIVRSTDIVQAIHTRIVPYHELPSIYNSFYPRALINNLVCAQQAIEGKGSEPSIFLANACNQDVFSAFSSLLFTDCFARTSIPLSISGISSKSIGMAYLEKEWSDTLKMDEKRFYSKIDNNTIIGPFSSYRQSEIAVVNEAIKVMDSYAEYLSLCLPPLKHDELASQLLKQYCQQGYIQSPWLAPEMIRFAIEFKQHEFLETLIRILNWYTTRYSQELTAWQQQQGQQDPIMTTTENYHIINCSSFGIESASQAALLYERYLREKNGTE